jgi:hypothetical protein
MLNGPAVSLQAMGFRDRFFTPRTASAIVSWRILLGVAVGVGAVLLGVPLLGGAAIGLIVYAASVVAAMPRPPARRPIDPFTVGEPWRHFVQSAQRSRRQLSETIRSTRPGPLRDRLQDIADRLDAGLQEGWEIVKRGNEIDAAIRALDPTRLRSRLDMLRAQSSSAPSEDLAAAVASVESQVATAGRLKELSASTADHLRLTQARLDELVARAAEISIGAGDTDRFSHDVDDLVLELEGLRQAVRELPG